ncbi:hypothetical protein IscW_ISCW018907 [Ixodes scapularis]|uniref:Uncharacterized protein n=1 Tax=Ixodes scapularis TaxID=6945 RepID=B7PQX3_IXOSC|nr:hypothetical protein IscW_ISCW018907 [Ixodes scapularis]|eukprot:XP_002436165.1 hypothetical protein IscW_ISCW018907 [Ixodes scapularis]
MMLPSAKRTSAPEPDGTTYAALKTLSEDHKEELLDWFNQPGEQIDGLGFTIYADDIKLRSKEGSIGQQEDTLETGFHAIDVFMHETGVSPGSGYNKTNRWFGFWG